MPVERYPVGDRAEWLARRRQDVTASEVGALLDGHDYVTPLMLYLDKAGVVPPDESDGPALRRGRLLEPVARALVSETEPDWRVTAGEVYLRDPDLRLGATPDVLVVDAAGRTGVVELKSVEPGAFRRRWMRDGVPALPSWIAAQALVGAALAEADFAAVGVLRVGWDIAFDLVPVEAPAGFLDRVAEVVAAFWAGVAAGQPPEPDWDRDADAVLDVARFGPLQTGRVVDLSGHNGIRALVAADQALAEDLAACARRRKALKAELALLMGPADAAVVDGAVVATQRMVARSGYSVPPTTVRELRIVRRSA